MVDVSVGNTRPKGASSNCRGVPKKSISVNGPGTGSVTGRPAAASAH